MHDVCAKLFGNGGKTAVIPEVSIQCSRAHADGVDVKPLVFACNRFAHVLVLPGSNKQVQCRQFRTIEETFRQVRRIAGDT